MSKLFVFVFVFVLVFGIEPILLLFIVLFRLFISKLLVLLLMLPLFLSFGDCSIDIFLVGVTVFGLVNDVWGGAFEPNVELVNDAGGGIVAPNVGLADDDVLVGTEMIAGLIGVAVIVG